MIDNQLANIDPSDRPESSAAIDFLHKAFVKRPENEAVSAAVERAVKATLRGPEGRGVVVTAPSGAGKTTLLERVIGRHSSLSEEPGSPCRYIKMKVPSPCTLKDLGRSLATKAGYPHLNTSHDAATIWSRARRELQAAKIRFILFDEIQNITEPAKKGDDQLIRNTLKDLLINSEWPVGLILAGQPSVVSFLEADSQVRRRMDFTKLEALDEKSVPRLEGTMTNLARPVGLNCVRDEVAHLAPRLIHAADYQFGSAIEILRKAIEIAAQGNRGGQLTREHFAREYANRTGNAAFANPFLAKDWAAIDPKRCNVTRPEQIIKEGLPPPRGRRGRRAAP